MRDDDDGQVDGDGSGAWAPRSPFAQSAGEQPWLRSGTPPWHMWGNSQAVTVTLSSGTFSEQARNQLTKISYGRPETWRWLFTARMLNPGLAPPVGTDLQVSIIWELTVGIGRSFQQNLAFDSWNILVTGGTSVLNRLLWANQASQVNNLGRFNNAGIIDPNPPPNVFSDIVAQDIQLNARVTLLLNGTPAGYPYSVTIETGAQWAPKTHVRPDWYLDGPTEMRFPGSEVGAK